MYESGILLINFLKSKEAFKANYLVYFFATSKAIFGKFSSKITFSNLTYGQN